MDLSLEQEVLAWIADDPDPKTAAQLQQWLDAGNESELRASFNGFLQFGTAGLRGPIRPGPSGMNRAVVGRAAAGIVAYMKERNLTSVVIGRDARYGSEDFTFETAEIMSGAGMKVYVLPRPLPTPVLAFATNELKCDVGIMVTASHNPPQDNGYKVYLGGTVDGIHYRGSQIVSPTDEAIATKIDAVSSLKSEPRGKVWEVLGEEIVDKYVNRTASLAGTPGSLRIVYTAMHGVGTETIQRVFQKAGFQSPILVQAQAAPDPDFPTVAFPNPEEPGAIDLALETARSFDAHLVIANDPDADRCAAAVNDPVSGWRMLRGDELGAIFAESIARKIDSGIFANSIVSSSIVKKIAEHYNLEFKETLTGFKWISKIDNLLFGYEEALGYCVDQKNVNDKDGISAALILVQIVNELKANGQSVFDYLEKLGNEYGFHRTDQISIRVTNLNEIDELLKKVTTTPPQTLLNNALKSYENLSESKVMPTVGVRLNYENGIRVIIRPSGTEPKIKCYIEVISSTKNEAENLISQIKQALTKVLT